MKDWKERLNQQFLFTQDKDFTWTAVPEGRCITGLTKTEDLIHFIEQVISERDKEVIKMLENTDVQMSVNGDVSQDEIAMAKFIYKAHIRHIIKKIGSAIIPPNPINGTLPSETDSATK